MPSSDSPKSGLEEARAIFDSEDHCCTWLEWVWKFKNAGVFVHDRERGLLLMATRETLVDGWPDAWHVWYASGSIDALAKAFPCKLDFVCWQRHKTKRLHFTKWDRITRLSQIYGRKFQH